MSVTPSKQVRLHENWYWKQRNAESCHNVLEEVTSGFSWQKAHTFPSEIHVEMMKIGHLSDPYLGFNEHKAHWIADEEWLYKCSFDTPSGGAKYANLTFEGLDTLCDVYLNGVQILTTNNMFRTYSYEALLSAEDTAFSKTSEPNIILLHFKSAKLAAKQEEGKYGKVRAGSSNLGDPSRVYVRKAQYHWRWDWGPELMACGPYRPITLTTYDVRIEEIQTKAFVDFSASTDEEDPVLTLKVNVVANIPTSNKHSFRVTLTDVGGKKIKMEHKTQVNSGNQTDIVVWNDLGKEGVKLWWPVGYGDQNMYFVEVALLGENDIVLDSQTKRIGFRSVNLVQEPLGEPDQYGTGTTFLFEVNNVRIFMGGSNWIPADCFLTTITEERYRSWLTLLKKGNQNMVRIWGGGIYEPDIFYDICDELGILVWQDFQFACGVYPAHDEFVENVKVEAEQNVKRLRHHPSIALFCGNNEDYQMVLQWGGINDLPAIKIYEHVLPEVVENLTDPVIPYHRGSPYGGKGWDTSDPTIGDVHQWNIWGGKELPYQDYDKLGGRFVSEFGMPSMPVMPTLEYWMDNAEDSQWHAQSPLISQHVRAGSYERRFAIAMNDNFRLTSDLKTHVFTTQLMQSEAVSYAYQVWRRGWRGKGREYTSGVLVWQLNDCWPVASWAIADYFLRAKPVYYTIARQLAPFAVGVFRNVMKNRDNDRPRQFHEFGAFYNVDTTYDVWITNHTLESRKVKYELNAFHWNNVESTVALQCWKLGGGDIELPPNQSTDIDTELRSKFLDDQARPLYPVVFSAQIFDSSTGKVLARYVDWPQPYKFLKIPDPKLKVTIKWLDGNGDTAFLTVNVDYPLKCLFFSVENESEGLVEWSDNALDVVPGDDQTITAKGLKGRKVRVAYLGKEKAEAVLYEL